MHLNKAIKTFVTISGCLFLGSSILFSDTTQVPVSIQTELLVKAMAYDRHVINREGNSLRIGIVYNENNLRSKEAFDQICKTLDELSDNNITVSGKRLTFSGIEFESKESLSEITKNLGIAVLYVTPGHEKYLASIGEVAQSKGVLTFCGNSSYVNSGIATGVEFQNGKPRVVIHLNTAKAQGSRFKAGFLKVARVIK